MMRSSMIILALTVFTFGQLQRCQGLALVPKSVRTALLSRFKSPSSPSSVHMKSQPMNEGAYASVTISENNIVNSEMTGFNGDDSIAASKKEMLNLVYERSMQRLLE
jgi:hypothetical protein